MKMYNKDGAEAFVEKEQVKLMADAGWSKTPFPSEEPEVQEELKTDKEETDVLSESDNTNKTPVGKRLLKKK